VTIGHPFFYFVLSISFRNTTKYFYDQAEEYALSCCCVALFSGYDFIEQSEII